MKQFSKYCTQIEKSFLRKYPTAIVDLHTISAIQIGGNYSNYDDNDLIFEPKHPLGRRICITFKSNKLAQQELDELSRILEHNGMTISTSNCKPSDIDDGCIIL